MNKPKINSLNSITCRITGFTFLAIALTVFILLYLANTQMTELFKEYLTVQHMEINPGEIMGPHEDSFLSSVHNSLLWVGLGILFAGLAASYALARSITVPLRNLSKAAAQIEQGNLKQTVLVESKDEVGHLALIFNQMSQTLATNTKLRQQLLANIAHELRTPLAIIQGNLEGMLDGVIEPDKEQLSSLHEEAVRLNRLIKDLRDLSLAEVRQLTLEKQPTDLNQLLNKTLSILKPFITEKQIQINCLLAKNLPKISVDPDRMQQVLNNLLLNAIRYSSLQGNIKIITTLTKDAGQKYLQLSIKDNGPGISNEDLPYIFDHFYRSDKSRDRKSGGSGIGLAIVKQLVENHGGQVNVASTLNAGSTFSVRLPILP